MSEIQLPIQTYTLRSRQASSTRILNCFPEKLPEDAKSPLLLTRTAGVVSWATVGNGPIQGMHAAHGLLYVVSGGSLYSVTTGGVATFLGAVGSTDNLDMDSNDTSVVVVNGDTSLAYYWTSPTFAQITDADFLALGAGDVEFVDNFLLFRAPSSGVFFSADLGSPSSFDALNFATAEGSPDDLVGMKVDHRQVILFGSQTTELWENTGASGFPFERMVNGFIEIGCANGRTIAKADNSVFWLADDRSIRRLEGATPVRISTHSVEQFVEGCTIASGRAWTFTLEGHIWYVISFDEGTRAYDITTGLWTELQTYGQDSWSWGHHTRFADRVLIGNRSSNVVGYLSPTTYDENGLTMVMEWTYANVYSDGMTAHHDRLQIDGEMGVGLTTGQGEDASVMLDVSDDSGVTWRSLPNKSLGRKGEYRFRAVWHALGSSKNRVYRARVSDPIQVTITNTLLETRGGRL